jgi:hypothetical protein
MLKSLCSSVPARKSWDVEQRAYLEQEFGFECLQSDGTRIYILCEGEDFIMLLNAVDYEQYFSTSKTLHKKFRSAVIYAFQC